MTAMMNRWRKTKSIRPWTSFSTRWLNNQIWRITGQLLTSCSRLNHWKKWIVHSSTRSDFLQIVQGWIFNFLKWITPPPLFPWFELFISKKNVFYEVQSWRRLIRVWERSQGGCGNSPKSVWRIFLSTEESKQLTTSRAGLWAELGRQRNGGSACWRHSVFHRASCILRKTDAYSILHNCHSRKKDALVMVRHFFSCMKIQFRLT